MITAWKTTMLCFYKMMNLPNFKEGALETFVLTIELYFQVFSHPFW